MKKIISFLIVFSLHLFSLQAQSILEWPRVESVHKPWVRWWWHGSAVEKKDLQWMLDELNSKGIGGVEITPIYGVKGEEDKFKSFLSRDWQDAVSFTLREAQKRGLGVDLANATGWPFGGPWVTKQDASKSIYLKKITSNGVDSWKDSLKLFREGFIRVANQSPLTFSVYDQKKKSGVSSQELSIDQLQNPEDIYPIALLAVDSAGLKIDLSDKLNNLSSMPILSKGKWTFYAAYSVLHGKMVERAAPGGEGYAIDHFSLSATRNYLSAFDSVVQSNSFASLRSFFNDSYEVDDAKGQANFSDELFSYFNDKMGYRLESELPALFGLDSLDKNRRVRYDYRMVVDEMILNNFTGTWTDWAHQKGKLTRNQSHGSPANTLDLYSRVDIPETEGTEIMRFKFASSAAHVSGKKLIAAETATWLNENFTTSWAQVKKAVDQYFLGGVNHIVYHGTAYSPQQASWPGWLFYAAVQFQPTNPQWNDFKKLNEYVTRVQSWLQKGDPSTDVLVYYPLADAYSAPGDNLLQHFDGMDKNVEGSVFSKAASWLLKNGYAFDFFSDRQVLNFSVNQQEIITEGNLKAKIILIPAVQYMEGKTLEKLLELARQGARIAFLDKLPDDVPGFYDYKNRSKFFSEETKQMRFASTVQPVELYALGSGMIFLGTDLQKILTKAAVPYERLSAKGLNWIRRELPEGALYFVENNSTRKINSLFKIPSKDVQVYLLNPITGDIGKARVLNDNEQNEFQLSIDKDETILILFSKVDFKVANYFYDTYLGKTDTLTGPWKIQFLSGGPALPSDYTTTDLSSWTEWPIKFVKDFSGSARYTLNFKWSGNSSIDYLLNFGVVHSTCSVKINGVDFGSLIGPQYTLRITGSILKEQNTIEVTVSNLMANRIAYLDRNGVAWKKFYNINMSAKHKENLINGVFSASSWKPFLSGLLGPVLLSPIE